MGNNKVFVVGKLDVAQDKLKIIDNGNFVIKNITISIRKQILEGQGSRNDFEA